MKRPETFYFRYYPYAEKVYQRYNPNISTPERGFTGRGGLTIHIDPTQPGKMIWSVVRCSSGDMFSRKIGRKIALERLGSDLAIHSHKWDFDIAKKIVEVIATKLDHWQIERNFNSNGYKEIKSYEKNGFERWLKDNIDINALGAQFTPKSTTFVAPLLTTKGDAYIP